MNLALGWVVMSCSRHTGDKAEVLGQGPESIAQGRGGQYWSEGLEDGHPWKVQLE